MRVTISTSPDPHLDSQIRQAHHQSDFIEPDHPNLTVSRHLEVGVSMDHNRPLPMSPGECERREGQAAYVSNAPIDTEGLPKPMDVQEGHHNGKPRSNPSPLDSSREIEHRGTHTVERKPAARTGELENKVSSRARFFVLLRV
jgi:hypothetical protein